VHGKKGCITLLTLRDQSTGLLFQNLVQATEIVNGKDRHTLCYHGTLYSTPNDVTHSLYTYGDPEYTIIRPWRFEDSLSNQIFSKRFPNPSRVLGDNKASYGHTNYLLA